MASTTTTIDPTTKAIQAALKAAGISTDEYAVPDKSTVSAWTSHFVPGISNEYSDYFDAIINAAKAEYGPTSAQVGEYIAQKAAWKEWAKSNATLQNLDLSGSKGKTISDAGDQVNAVRKILVDQTKAVNEAAKLGTAKLNTDLYGTGTVDKPASGSLGATLSAKQAALTKAQAAYDKKPTAKTEATLNTAKTAYGDAKIAYDTAEKAVADNAQKTFKPTEAAIHSAYTTYLDKAYTPFTNFLGGVTTADVPAGTDPTEAKVNAAVEQWKKTGYMPTVDSSILGQVQTAYNNYMQEKTEADAKAKAVAAQKDSPQKIAQTKADIANINALIAQAAQKAPTVAALTTDILNKMREAKGEAQPGMGLAQLTDYVGNKRGALGTSAAPQINAPKLERYTPPPQASNRLPSQIPQLGLNLSNDFNTRMIQQDLAAQQERQVPGTYATGQFDPLYSGYLSASQGYGTQASPMSPGGTWVGGALYATPSKVGFGIQNAYDTNTFDPNAVTGKAAGGYLDAQSVGQSNQAMQPPQQNNNQLGLGSIPNMSQYTNYTGNPGITSPTQNTDDGGIGGVSVLGQTNPVW